MRKGVSSRVCHVCSRRPSIASSSPPVCSGCNKSLTMIEGVPMKFCSLHKRYHPLAELMLTERHGRRALQCRKRIEFNESRTRRKRGRSGATPSSGVAAAAAVAVAVASPAPSSSGDESADVDEASNASRRPGLRERPSKRARAVSLAVANTPPRRAAAAEAEPTDVLTPRAAAAGPTTTAPAPAAPASPAPAPASLVAPSPTPMETDLSRPKPRRPRQLRRIAPPALVAHARPASPVLPWGAASPTSDLELHLDAPRLTQLAELACKIFTPLAPPAPTPQMVSATG